MPDEVEITIASHPRWLRLIRQVVEEFAREAGFDPQDSHAITLAVGEAAGNVMKHSYQGRTDRTFSVACNLEPDGVEVTIRDTGEPFDPSCKPVLAPDEIRPGGRGLFLMRAIMDEIEYQRENGSNWVRMKKFLKTPART